MMLCYVNVNRKMKRAISHNCSKINIHNYLDIVLSTGKYFIIFPEGCVTNTAVRTRTILTVTFNELRG